MRRFVIGTAGHVDHGKTSLVRALTGIDTDRLPEEKRRGITIELGFAPWSLGDGVEVSLIDVPGHRRLVHTMIAGAIGMELVLLVVAADEGVMPQTREHVAACALLGIRRAVIAVTKLDRVGAEVAGLAGEEALELTKDRFASEVVLCSAKTGEGVEAVRDAVKRALSTLGSARSSGRARLSVDRAFSVKGAGTVVTGTLVEGRISTGSKLFVAGEAGSTQVVARGLHVHDHAVTVAEAPTRLAVNLAGLPLEAVRRGDVVTDDERVRSSRVLDVALRAPAGQGGGTGSAAPPSMVRRGVTVQVYLGTSRTAARVAIVGEELARLRLARPLVAVGGDRFVLRGSDTDGPAGAVLGGGEVLDADPPKRRPRRRRAAVLAALQKGDATATVRALVAEAAPRPLLYEALASRFSIASLELRKAADSLAGKGELYAIKGAGYITSARLTALIETARSLVAEHAKRSPLDRGLALATMRQRLEASGPEVAEEAIRRAASPSAAARGEPIVIEGDVARPATLPSSPRESSAAGVIEAAIHALREAAQKGVSEFQMKEAIGVSPKETKAVLAKLVRDGVAAHTGELWFHRPKVDELRAKITEHIKREGRLTIAAFKEMSGLGRKQVIVLLELFDREGVTRREGDDRLPGPSFLR